MGVFVLSLYKWKWKISLSTLLQVNFPCIQWDHCACVIDSCYTLIIIHIHRDPSHHITLYSAYSSFVRHNFISQYINNTELLLDSVISSHVSALPLPLHEIWPKRLFLSLSLANQCEIDCCWPFYYKVLTENFTELLPYLSCANLFSFLVVNTRPS